MSKDTQREPPYRCIYCGVPSWLDPCDQSPPPDYCHESDHGEPDPDYCHESDHGEPDPDDTESLK